MRSQLSLAALLLAASSSYCYSDTTYGITNNAALGGLSWGMGTVLPDATGPWVSLQVHGLTYRYKMVKDPETDAIVYVRNVDAVNGGYVFEEKDDWSGTPGGTIQKYFRFPYIDSARWGTGSIDLEGDGVIEDASVTYNYKMEVDEMKMKCSLSPLSDPACPGFQDALLKYLNSLESLNPDDPFYDEWIQANMSLNDEEGAQEQQEQAEEPEEELSNFEKELGGENSIGDLVDTDQQNRILAALAQVPKIESYYILDIPGGEYKDAVLLEDTVLPDNPRAMRNLASDATHRSIVRSQYDREQ